jgi:transposase
MSEHLPACDAGNFEDPGSEAATVRPEPRTQRRKRSSGRRWSRADKWRIVEESYQPGTSVSLVARRYDVNANQVFNWRREAREGRLGKPPAGISAARDETAFLSLGVLGGNEDGVGPPTVSPPASSIPAKLPASAHADDDPHVVGPGVIEITLPGGIRLRVGSSIDDETLRRVLAVVKGA